MMNVKSLLYIIVLLGIIFVYNLFFHVDYMSWRGEGRYVICQPKMQYLAAQFSLLGAVFVCI